MISMIMEPGNTKWGEYHCTVDSCLTCLDLSVLQIKTKIVSCHTTDSKPVKQEVNSRVILSPFCVPWKNAPTSRARMKGRISAVDLHVLTSSDQILLILKIYFYFLRKHGILKRRSTVLSLLLSQYSLVWKELEFGWLLSTFCLTPLPPIY